MKKGFTYGWDAHRGMYKTDSSFDSMKRLCNMGTNYVTLAFAVMQEKFSSSRFGFDYRRTVTDLEIIKAIKRLNSLGQSVCLKPIINCEDGVWRANISFPDIEFPVIGGREEKKYNTYWDEWFSCYTAFMCHYAEIAEDLGVEMLCIGCEMLGTERKESYWRELIKEVRKVYSGELVYNTNHGSEENVNWFDAVDYIGTSAYYRVGINGTDVVSMCKEWEKVKPTLKRVSEKFGKKIIFMEIGCRSAKGCSAMPWDFLHVDLPYDEEEQNNFYESALISFWNEPWFDGFFWWDWQTEIPETYFDHENTGFSIIGKKTEKTLTDWYKNK